MALGDHAVKQREARLYGPDAAPAGIFMDHEFPLGMAKQAVGHGRAVHARGAAGWSAQDGKKGPAGPRAAEACIIGPARLSGPGSPRGRTVSMGADGCLAVDGWQGASPQAASPNGVTKRLHQTASPNSLTKRLHLSASRISLNRPPFQSAIQSAPSCAPRKPACPASQSGNPIRSPPPRPQTSTRSMPPALAWATYCCSQSGPSSWRAISTTM